MCVAIKVGLVPCCAQSLPLLKKLGERKRATVRGECTELNHINRYFNKKGKEASLLRLKGTKTLFCTL